MTIMGKTFGLDAEGNPRKQEAGEALLAVAQTLGRNAGTVGEYRGFGMSFYMEQATGKVYLNLQGATTHNVELGTSVLGNLARIENAINGIPQRLEATRGQLSNYQNQVKAAEDELQRPFPHADELKEKSARLAKLNAELTMSESSPSPKPEEPPSVEPTEAELEDIGITAPEATEKTYPAPPVDEAVNFRGMPPSVSGETIRNMKLIEGEPVIYMNPRTDGQQYKGTILHVDKEQGYCVQLSGKHSLFVHSLDRLERVPEVGENLKLSYPRETGHKATLSVQETPSQTRTRGRK